jgi:hypothetical protein
MFNLPDPNWIIDNRSDPVRHDERSDRSKRNAANRRNMFQPAGHDTKVEPMASIPGTFPAATPEQPQSSVTFPFDKSENGTAREDPKVQDEAIQEIERPTTLITHPIRMLSYPPVGSNYEGPHSAFQPVQIRQEIHELALRNTETAPSKNPTLAAGPSNPEVNRTAQPLLIEDTPTLSLRRAEGSVRTTSSDTRKKSEEIRELREEMEKLRRTNLDLQNEITTIRLRRSSRAPSRASSMAEAGEPINTRFWTEMDDI